MARVLLVDDDIELVDLLKDYLQGEGFAVDIAHDGLEGINGVRFGNFDLVVLDVMMPGIDGIETLARIRAISDIPVIMLTARGEDQDRITGLEKGADDYVPKPCTPRELVARIRAILKRIGKASAPPATEQSIVIGPLCVVPAQRLVTKDGIDLVFTSSEFDLFELLARNAGRPVSKAALSVEALGRPLARFDRSIDVHISSMRAKLGALPDGRSWIQTVFRKGYQLVMA